MTTTTKTRTRKGGEHTNPSRQTTTTTTMYGVGGGGGSVSQFNAALSRELDYTETLESLIAHVWPTRKHRINHDLTVVNFVHLFRTLWFYVQLVVLLHSLHAAGYNWDLVDSLHRVFAPTYVCVAIVVATYCISLAFGAKLSAVEKKNPALRIYGELSATLRLVYHGVPVPIYGVGAFVLYSVVGCHLNNANRGSRMCATMGIGTVTGILSVGLVLDILHILFNFYQIETHTREPRKRSTLSRLKQPPFSYDDSAVSSTAAIPLIQPPLTLPPQSFHQRDDDDYNYSVRSYNGGGGGNY